MDAERDSAPYTAEIQEIGAARTLHDINAIVDRFPIDATAPDGALYSGRVGTIHVSEFVTRFDGHTSVAIIDGTISFWEGE